MHLFSIGYLTLSKTVTTGELYCFVCDETHSQDLGCSSALFSAPLTSCRGTFDAHYCIKTVGLYAGLLLD